MQTFIRFIICTSWVATMVALVPIWVPLTIVVSTGVLYKELKGDTENV